MADNVAVGLKRIPRYLYRGSFKRLIQRTGLDPYLKRAYFELYRLSSGGTESVEFDGVTTTFEVSTYHEYHVVNVADTSERPALEAVLDHLESGDVFYDVGANIGTYTCIVGTALDEGQVVAFEPYPPNVDRLQRNAELNGVDVDVIPAALSSSTGSTEFHVLESTASGSQEGSIDREYPDLDRSVATTEVETVPGDALVDAGRIQPPNVVKVDVEGAGADVLAGLEASLSRDDCRLLCVEPHGNREALEDLIRDYGFDIEHLTLSGERETEDPTILARKRR